MNAKKINSMLVVLVALTANTFAHPGPAGHKHPEGDSWPFPPIEWNIVIAAFIALGVVMMIKKLAKW